MSTAPRVFISYSWDSPEHKKWVSNLAEALRANGVDAILDQWDLAPGDDLPTFVERNLRSADAVLAILTERYNEEAKPSRGGVGYERALITEEILQDFSNKLIPIVRSAAAARTMPSSLRDRFYLDFSDESDFSSALHSLLRTLFEAQTTKKPGIGKLPTFVSEARRNLFITYSHTDSIWLERFQTMLKPAVDRSLISIWADTNIKAGANWRQDIQGALDQSKVALLLVSPHFLASDYIAQHELPPLLDAAAQDGLTVVWVPVSSSFYTLTDIEKYQAAHNPGQPLDTLTPARRNKAILVICEQILEALNSDVG